MATKLPSGAWRTQVFDGVKDNGKREYISFIAPTEDEADLLALEYKIKKKNAGRPERMTVGEAIDRYIESKDAVLSPTTIKAYKSMRRNLAADLMQMKLNKITNSAVQLAINKESKSHTPKTIRNLHGLISSALKQNYPEMTLTTTLPKKVKHEIIMPDETDIKNIISRVAGSIMELPVLFAVCLGLRRSEICGLTWDNVNLEKRTIKISQAKVSDENNEWVIKNPKSYAGNRVLTIPDVLYNALLRQENKTGYVVKTAPGTITNKFKLITSELNIPRFRFHDLRHYNASVMLALGIPDKYAMERMGHTTNNMLKNVYQHTFDNEKEKINQTINNHFDSLIDDI